MPTLFQEFSFGFRSLRKSPAFALSAIFVLMLGIGANSAIFSVVNAVLLRPLPFPNSADLAMVFHVPPAKAFPGIKTFSVSPANYIDWRAAASVFSDMAVYSGRAFRVTDSEVPKSVTATMPEASFFDVLKIQAAVGRVFRPEECQIGRDDVVVLSHHYAQANFGSAAAALGRTMHLDGRAYRIIGILAPEARVRSWPPTDSDVFVPLTWTPAVRAERQNHNHLVVARLAHGVSMDKARAEMDVISARLARQYPEANTGWGATVVSLRDTLVGDVRVALLTLLGAVTFVLLIACANVANLVLARTLGRRKELAIRSALGASRGRALRTVLVETTMLALAGGALGLLFAEYAIDLVVATLAAQMPRATEVTLDGRVIVFTLLISVLTGLAAGSIAAWRSVGFDLNESLKQGLGKTDTVSSGSRTRSLLVVAEVALSLMLLVGASLMLRSLWSLYSVDPGFETRNVATMVLPVPKDRLYSSLLPAIRALPGVEAAGAVDTRPLTDDGSHQPIVIEGRPAEVFAMQPNIDVRVITPGYLKALQMPVLRGRDFDQTDTLSKAPPILISDSMAKAYWPGENPIGRRLTISFTPDVKHEVVGVVGDVKVRGVDVLEPVPMIYIPMPENLLTSVFLTVRSAEDPTRLASAIQTELNRIDPGAPIRNVESMESILTKSLAPRRFSMFLFAAFAGLALLLAAVGMYSVLSYSVRRRAQEIGVRMAVGAQTRDILRLIVVEGMRPALLGAGIGLVGAYLAGELLSTMVYGVSTTDPVTFAAVLTMLGAVALLACLLPAYRATRVEPVIALRSE